MDVVLLGVLTIIAMLIHFSDGDKNKVWKISGGLLLLIAGWLSISLSEDMLVEQEIEQACVNVNGVQIICYVAHGDLKIVNVNKKFERAFPDGHSFNIKIYDSGPYFGLAIPYVDEITVNEEL